MMNNNELEKILGVFIVYIAPVLLLLGVILEYYPYIMNNKHELIMLILTLFVLSVFSGILPFLFILYSL